MPEVIARHPADAFQHPDAKAEFKRYLAKIVAQTMYSADYEGDYHGLSPNDIDVILVSYEPEDVTLGSVFVLTITGYDYPGRMKNMAYRLAVICNELAIHVALMNTQAAAKSDAVPVRFEKGERKLFAATYVPIREGCWTSSPN